MHSFFWLTSQVIGSLINLWPVTLILFLLIGIAGSYTFLSKPASLRVRHLLIFAPLLLSLLILVWGSLMGNNGPNKAPSWPSNILVVLFWLHVLSAIGIVYIMKGLRWFTASVLLFECVVM